jgi:uncharacterized protein involved in type VI secretion and phage assembly
MPSIKYVAQPILKIDGQAAPVSLLEDILELAVEESLHLPAMFTLVVNNPLFSGIAKDKTWQHEKLFAIGKSVKIGFSSATTEAKEFDDSSEGNVFDGEITAIETNFSSTSQALMIIRGYDKSHRLHRGRFNRSFQNMTDTDILKRVIGEVGLSAGKMDSSGAPHDYVFQENQTNMQFFRERAARNGFELFVQDGKLHFRKPKSDNSIDLEWLTNLQNFRVRVSSSEQVSSVEVRGWDYVTKKPIVSTKSSAKVLTSTGASNSDSSSFQGYTSSPKLIVVDQPIDSSAEADSIAQALVDELGGEFVQADAKADGNPKLRPGRLVNLSGMGTYSGKYYVTETRHLYQARIYSTEFNVRGLRSGDLLTTLAPPNRLQPGQTLLVGTVTNNNDPKKMGRVRVQFPTLTEEHDSNWARVVAMGAGADRGFDCLPEIGDEVLVAFEHGDIHRPYVIGNVWNGVDKPPSMVTDSVVDGKVRLRTFKTRAGHTLQFVDEDKGSTKQGVTLTTKSGHNLQFNDTEKKIHLKTEEGHTIELDDTSKKITIQTTGGNSCILDDQSQKISIDSKGEITMNATQKIMLTVGASSIEISNTGIILKSGGSKIDIKAATIDVASSGMTTVKGAMTTIKGDGMVTVSAPVINLN